LAKASGSSRRLRYLQLIGEPVEIHRDHAANVSFARQHARTAVYAAVSNDDEWEGKRKSRV
jgi:hypothetical protein